MNGGTSRQSNTAEALPLFESGGWAAIAEAGLQAGQAYCRRLVQEEAYYQYATSKGKLNE